MIEYSRSDPAVPALMLMPGIISTLRESFRSDGAEGESVHALCSAYEHLWGLYCEASRTPNERERDEANEKMIAKCHALLDAEYHRDDPLDERIARNIGRASMAKQNEYSAVEKNKAHHSLLRRLAAEIFPGQSEIFNARYDFLEEENRDALIARMRMWRASQSRAQRAEALLVLIAELPSAWREKIEACLWSGDVIMCVDALEALLKKVSPQDALKYVKLRAYEQIADEAHSRESIRATAFSRWLAAEIETLRAQVFGT